MEHRILTLNILHGGGPRVERLLMEIEREDPDTLVLTEFRHGPTGARIMDGLRRLGLPHQVGSPTAPGVNGILVASRSPLALEVAAADPGWDRKRHLVVRLETLTLVAVYLQSGKDKLVPWEALLETASRLREQRTVLAGDFNTGKHRIDELGATFIGAACIDRLEALGFVDAWRSRHPHGREFTWYSSKGNGFRLDAVFVSPPLADAIAEAGHLHHFRQDKHTDHAALLVSVDLPYSTDYQPWPRSCGIDQIEIATDWNGLSDSELPFACRTRIVRDGERFRRWDGTTVDPALVQALWRALVQPGIPAVDLSSFGLTRPWLEANAARIVDCHLDEDYEGFSRAQRDLLVASMQDPGVVAEAIRNFLHPLQPMRTDDLPSIDVRIRGDGEDRRLSSRSQTGHMLPWEVEVHGHGCEDWNAGLSMALAALMPPEATNQDRLAGLDFEEQLLDAVWRQVQAEWDRLG